VHWREQLIKINRQYVIFSPERRFSFSFSLLIDTSWGVVIVQIICETVHRVAVRGSLAMANAFILNSFLKSFNGTGDAGDRGEPSNVARFYICNDFIGSGRTPKDPLLSTRISYWHRATTYLRPRALRNAAYCIVFVSRIATRVIGPEHTVQDVSSEPGESYTVIASVSTFDGECRAAWELWYVCHYESSKDDRSLNPSFSCRDNGRRGEAARVFLSSEINALQNAITVWDTSQEPAFAFLRWIPASMLAPTMSLWIHTRAPCGESRLFNSKKSI